MQDITFFVCRRNGFPEGCSTNVVLSSEDQHRIALALEADDLSVPLANGPARLVRLHPDRVLVITNDRPQRLTRRQREVAEFAAVGATVDEIARSVGLSPYTVRQHLKAVYRELDVGNRVELAQAMGTYVG